MLSVNQGGIKYHVFEFLVWFDLGLNSSLPGYWWTLYLLDQYNSVNYSVCFFLWKSFDLCIVPHSKTILYFSWVRSWKKITWHFFQGSECSISTSGDICVGCLNIHGTHVTDNNSTNNNGVFFFESDLKIVYYNNYYSLITMPWTREEKIFSITTYLETKPFKTVSKKMQPIVIIMIYFWDKKLKKSLHVQEADIITIKKKHWFDVSSSKNPYFTGHLPNDHHCAYLSSKSLSY